MSHGGPRSGEGPVSGRTPVGGKRSVDSAHLAFTNHNVQRLRRLLGRRSARLDEGAFVVEGEKVLAEALDAGRTPEIVFVTANTWCPVLDRCRAAGVPVEFAAPGVLDRVGDTVTPQQIMAILPLHSGELDDLLPAAAAGGFVLVAVDVADPGNAGTILRSAEVSGAAGVIFCGTSVDTTNPKVVRASAGALFHVPAVVERSPLAALTWLHQQGFVTWATSVHGDGVVTLDDADLTGATAVVLGNEAHGLSASVADACAHRITIPMAGRTESLNVAMAATLLSFEAARQRRR